jgi:hypothetical protein
MYPFVETSQRHQPASAPEASLCKGWVAFELSKPIKGVAAIVEDDDGDKSRVLMFSLISFRLFRRFHCFAVSFFLLVFRCSVFAEDDTGDKSPPVLINSRSSFVSPFGFSQT